MDNIDKLYLLRELLHDTSKSHSAHAGVLSTLNDLIAEYEISARTPCASSTELQSIATTRSHQIASIISTAYNLLNAMQKCRMDPSTWDTKVPLALHIQKDLPGYVAPGRGGWDFPPSRSFQVRGTEYLHDGVKVSCLYQNLQYHQLFT